jgi:hypothetical protein
VGVLAPTRLGQREAHPKLFSTGCTGASGRPCRSSHMIFYLLRILPCYAKFNAVGFIRKLTPSLSDAAAKLKALS